MDIVQILKQDYQDFPVNQTYSIYAENVYFRDPLNEFRGVERFKQMLGFIDTWFRDIKMDLHHIRRSGNTIAMEWTLNMTSPRPWKPRLAIPGRTEFKLNDEELIISHIDYWHTSRLDVLKQNLFSAEKIKT